jgi:glycogen debranching enzyme
MSTLRDLAHQCLLDLSTPDGIYASGREDVYGCVFGRDSALTILKIIKAHTTHPSLELLEATRGALINLTRLQGKEFNMESGEEPGKFVHEYRDTPEKMERLLKLDRPWFVYPDNTIKNYDSIDATPLGLIAIYKYWQITGDSNFLIKTLPSVEAGLNWIISYGDLDKDLFLEYILPTERKSGGLVVQSWTDSIESIRQLSGELPPYPIAPVEVQAYAWLALKLWGDFYSKTHPDFGKKLLSQADQLKQRFNDIFIIEDEGHYFAPQALDGAKRKINTITANPLLCLWAVYESGDKKESIFEDRYIEHLVDRAFMSDLFDDQAGIRTMSSHSQTFNPDRNSYHNGSFWPILNGLIHEGLLNFGFKKEAAKLQKASLMALDYFQSPIELYVKTSDGKYEGYMGKDGQGACLNQAWSAAAMLDLLT